jgi:hypothetical protein
VISDHKEKLRRANVLHFFTNASPGQLDFCRDQKNRSPVSLQCSKETPKAETYCHPSTGQLDKAHNFPYFCIISLLSFSPRSIRLWYESSRRYKRLLFPAKSNRQSNLLHTRFLLFAFSVFIFQFSKKLHFIFFIFFFNYTELLQLNFTKPIATFRHSFWEKQNTATSITTSIGYTYSQLDLKKEKFRLADASLFHRLSSRSIRLILDQKTTAGQLDFRLQTSSRVVKLPNFFLRSIRRYRSSRPKNTAAVWKLLQLPTISILGQFDSIFSSFSSSCHSFAD